MQILDILSSRENSAAIENLTRSFNIDSKTAETAVGAIVPQLTRSMERNTLSRGGLADLLQSLSNSSRQRYLDPGASLTTNEALADGNSILEQILGSKDMSRKTAERAARETGIDAALLKQLLPAVAGMVMGGLSRETAGPIGDLLQRMGLSGSPLPLPGEAPRPSSQAPKKLPGTGDWQQPSPGPSGGGTFRRQSPLPIPGDDLPGLGRQGSGLDDLSDILRRGREARPVQVPGAPADGGSLWNIIRSILADVLGFQNRGLLGWLVRLIVIRWGWGLLKRILTRALRGR